MAENSLFTHENYMFSTVFDGTSQLIKSIAKKRPVRNELFHFVTGPFYVL